MGRFGKVVPEYHRGQIFWDMWVKKQDTLHLPITLPHADQFSKSFHRVLNSKFAVKRLLKIPSPLKHVATLFVKPYLSKTDN